MRTMVSALHFEWNSIDHCADRVVREFGLQGVELSFHESFARPHCTLEDLDRLTPVREEYGITLAAHLWENLAQLGPETASERLVRWLDVCVRHKVEGLVIHGGTYPDQSEGIARTVAALRKALPGFEKHHVVLNLENHYAYAYRNCQELFSEPWEFLEVLPVIDSPSLRFCFDTGHGNMTRNSTELIRGLGPYLSHVHLADNHGVDDDHVPYRTGTTDWDSVFDLLGRIGFDGTFCVEFPVRDDTAPFEACLRDIRARWPQGG